MKREVFAGGMATLGVTFNREISVPLLDAYWTALESLGEDELTAAFGRALTECRFFPAPAELLEFAGIILESHEERRRRITREQTQAEIDDDVERTNARLDTMYGRTRKALPSAPTSIVHELADAKSIGGSLVTGPSTPDRQATVSGPVTPRVPTRITDEEKNAALARIAAQLAARAATP